MNPENYQKYLRSELLRNLQQDQLLTNSLFPETPNHEYSTSGVISWDFASKVPEPPQEALLQTAAEVQVHEFSRADYENSSFNRRERLKAIARQVLLSALEHECRITWGCSLGFQTMSVQSQEWKQPINDTSCQYFNDNPYLRCAVNPEGECDGCTFHLKIT